MDSPLYSCFELHLQIRRTLQKLSIDSISLVLKSAADKARGTCEAVPERVHCHMI